MERKDGPYWAQMMDGEDCVVERARGFYWQPGVEVSMPFSLLTNLEPIPTRDELRELVRVTPEMLKDAEEVSCAGVHDVNDTFVMVDKAGWEAAMRLALSLPEPDPRKATP